MKRWLEAIWYRPERPPRVLRPLSVLYGAVADRLAQQRKRAAQRLPVPVIVVGNLAVGGTGKTPVTLWLVEALRRRGYTPGVLSRGYGGHGPFPQAVSEHSDAAAVGDEPALIAQRTRVPLAVAPDRVAAGRLLLARHPEIDVLVCDDGLQHYRLARDLELCVVDGARGFGNGWRLPAGPLREPQTRAVTLILVNGADADGYGDNAVRFDLCIGRAFNLYDGRARALREFAGQPLHAVAGIGHPARFFAALRAAGLEVIEHAFPDHHRYAARELAFADTAPILMTEKDAVKCHAFADPRLWSVPAELELAAPAATRLNAVFAMLPPPKSPVRSPEPRQAQSP